MPACPDQLDKGQAAAIENRDFKVVDLHVGVIDPTGIENAQQVLGGGDQDALPHQAGGVADTRDVAPACGDVEIVKIGANENDACRDRRRQNANLNRYAAVETDSRGLYGALDRRLKAQSEAPGDWS